MPHQDDGGVDASACEVWRHFSAVEADAAINALRRWQTSFTSNTTSRKQRGPVVLDPYIRLILDRILPKDVEKKLLAKHLDVLMQDLVACRTAVIDETILGWAKQGITQVLILASGFDTRAWRLRWPTGIAFYEVDSAMVTAQKMVALADVEPSCVRHALIGDVYDLERVFRGLTSLGFDSTQPAMVVIEDVVEHMLPELASDMFAVLAGACAPGSRLVVTLSDCKLRDLLKRHGTRLIEDYEPPGVVLNRIANAGWKADFILSGELETRFGVDLHGCLYIVKGLLPAANAVANGAYS